MTIEHFGSGRFCRTVPCSGPQMRVMEAAGVVKPIKTTGGWRMFKAEDVLAARTWMQQNVKRRLPR